MATRNYTNNAEPQTLTSDIDDTDTIVPVGDTSTYPPAPFTIVLDRRQSGQEVCLCTGKTSLAFTVTRGFDGTTAVAHTSGIPVEHTTAALDYAEANAHLQVAHLAPSTVDSKGDLLVGTAADTLDRLPVGTDGYSLIPEATEDTGLRYEKSRGTIVCTSSSRPTLGLYEGIRIFETDTKLFYVRIGSGWMPEPGQLLGFYKQATNSGFASGLTQRMSLGFTMPTLTAGRRVKITSTCYFFYLAAPYTGHVIGYGLNAKGGVAGIGGVLSSQSIQSVSAIGIPPTISSIDNTDIPPGPTTVYYYTLVTTGPGANLSHYMAADATAPAYMEAMII